MSMDSTIHPIHDKHDRIFKLVLGRRPNMVSLLRAILSRATASHIDWQRIDYIPTELHTADGKLLRADIIVELPLIDDGGRYIGVVEHKSYQEAGTYYQMYGYVDACERMYAAYGMVIPIVYYHGDRPWPTPKIVALETLRLLVVDLLSGDLDEAKLTVELRALAEVQRAGRGVSEATVLTELTKNYLHPLYEQYEESKVVFDELERYILDIADGAGGLTTSEVLEIIEKHTGKEAREMGKSFLEQARDEGRTEGRVEGRTEGRVEERTEVALRLLRMDSDSDMVHEATGLATAEIEQLRHSLNGS